MLRQLAIHNIVLVERLELEFEAGLGVLTGETGAGKSILLDALGLALGARADTGLVRSGQDSAVVSAEIELPRDHPVIGLLVEQGVATEPGERLIVRRTLKSDGGSRSFVGGASVPAGLLRDVGAMAVEIHGQHDDRGLLNPKGHRALLDAFGRLEAAAVEHARAEVTRIEASCSRCGPLLQMPSATANGSSMQSPRSRRFPPKKGRRAGSPRNARPCRPASRPAIR
jgi:DNA repair protein RecN (Recombination protein N)